MGFVGEVAQSSSRTFKNEALQYLKKRSENSDELELVLYAKSHLGDGSLSNIVWLQELPDPVTIIVWDNYASVSLKLAESLKLKQGDLVDVQVGMGESSKSLTLPIHIQPGLHDSVVTVALGYGRTHAGEVGNGIGQNAYPLISVFEDKPIFSGQSVKLKKLGRKYDLVTTQGHDSMEGRQIVVTATNKDY